MTVQIVGVFEANNQLMALLDRVGEGAEMFITRRAAEGLRLARRR